MPGNTTHEAFLNVLESYRRAPGRTGAAAAAGPVNVRTSKRMWEKGVPWAPDPYKNRPLCEVIADEQAEARAARAAADEARARAEGQLEAERLARRADVARQDANKTRNQETQMVALARGSVSGLLVSLTGIAKGAAVLGGKVQHTLEQLAAQEALSFKEAGEALRMINRLSTAVRQASDAAGACIEMERVLAGEPTSHVKHTFENIPEAEAMARIERAHAAMQRRRAWLAQQSPAEPSPRELGPARALAANVGVVIDMPRMAGVATELLGTQSTHAADALAASPRAVSEPSMPTPSAPVEVRRYQAQSTDAVITQVADAIMRPLGEPAKTG